MLSSLSSLRRLGLTLLLVLPALAGCDDDPFRVDWVENPDTVRLYSLARPELNLLSAFDFIGRYPVSIESPNAAGQWDLALDTQGGALVFLPPRSVGIQASKSGVAPMPGADFQEVRVAPSDTSLYIGDRPVKVEVGTTYVVRTRQTSGYYGTLCVYYGKLEPLAIDVQEGTLTFVFDTSPVCNDRKLYPPKK